MRIFKLLLNETDNMIAIVENGGNVISTQTFFDTPDAEDSAISLLQDLIHLYKDQRPEPQEMSLDHFLKMYCSVSPDKVQ